MTMFTKEALEAAVVAARAASPSGDYHIAVAKCPLCGDIFGGVSTALADKATWKTAVDGLVAARNAKLAAHIAAHP